MSQASGSGMRSMTLATVEFWLDFVIHVAGGLILLGLAGSAVGRLLARRAARLEDDSGVKQ